MGFPCHQEGGTVLSLVGFQVSGASTAPGTKSVTA